MACTALLQTLGRHFGVYRAWSLDLHEAFVTDRLARVAEHKSILHDIRHSSSWCNLERQLNCLLKTLENVLRENEPAFGPGPGDHSIHLFIITMMASRQDERQGRA